MTSTTFTPGENEPPHPLGSLAAEEPKKRYLWVPNSFASQGEIYILAATHRGDMYHIRGAMTLEPHPLIVYNCTDKTTELTDYLAKNTPSVFLTSWTWDQLSGDSNPGDSGYSKREFTLLSESYATTIISKSVKKDEDLKKLARGMAYIDEADEKDLRVELENLCKELFAKEPSSSRKKILILYRDTGTKGGVYPELDSGTASIEKIAQYLRDIPQKDANLLDVKLCGNAKPIGTLHSIGEYFRKINSSKWHKETKRDIETFFLQVAFDLGYFDMVVGFRSGGLDVFTFLGIPSISISARQMVGEGRHAKLAVNNLFKRWNIQYELPRHICTKYFADGAGNTTQLGSPWWKFSHSTEPTTDDLAKQSIPPSSFHQYDERIVQVGIYNAIRILLPWRVDPFVKPPVQNRQFCNETCRPCYFSNLDRNGVCNYFKAQKELEDQDFVTRKQQIDQTNESAQDYGKWEAKMKQDWEKILKKCPTS